LLLAPCRRRVARRQQHATRLPPLHHRPLRTAGLGAAMQIRIEETMWAALNAHLLERTDLETAAILLAEPISSEATTVLAVRAWAGVPDDGYLTRRVDQIRIDPIAINRLVRPARESGFSVLTVHSHPMSLDAWFSHADDLGDARLLPSFARLVPGVPHGSL